MDRSENSLSPGSLLIGLGAILMLVSLFLDWYGAEGVGISAWTAFEIVDILLAAGVLLAAYLALPRGLGVPGEESRARGEGALIPLSVFVLLLVAVNVASVPPAANGADVEVGAWLALAAALLIVAGAFLTRTSVSLVVRTAPRERRAGPADAPTTEQPTEVARPTGPEGSSTG